MKELEEHKKLHATYNQRVAANANYLEDLRTEVEKLHAKVRGQVVNE